MTLELLDDTTAAQWLLPSTTDRRSAEAVLWFGPAGFEACVRVLQLPDPAYDGQADSTLAAEELDRAPSDLELVSGVVGALEPAERVLHLLLWDGFPWRPDLPGTTRVDVAGMRTCALARGILADFSTWVQAGEASHGRAFPPAFVWPEDRSWCLAFEVESHFAGVGCSADAAAALLRTEGLEVVPATWGEPVASYA